MIAIIGLRFWQLVLGASMAMLHRYVEQAKNANEGMA